MMEWFASDSAPAWAQAILSALAIAVAGWFAVWVPSQERKINADAASRARLKVVTTFFGPAGLRLLIFYEPEFRHIGIVARVSLLSPEGATLRVGKVEPTPALTGGAYFVYVPWSECVESVGTVRLIKQDNDPTPQGVLYIVPSGFGPPGTGSPIVAKARVKVEIRTDADDVLLSQEFNVSAIDPPA